MLVDFAHGSADDFEEASDDGSDDSSDKTSDESGQKTGDEAIDSSIDDSSSEISLLWPLAQDTVSQITSEVGWTTEGASVLRTYLAEELAEEFEDGLTDSLHGESALPAHYSPAHSLPAHYRPMLFLPTRSAPARSSAADSSSTGFLSLPSELRNEIYKLVIIDHQSQGEVTAPPGLLNACREIRNEAIKLYYATCHFRIHAKDVQSWANAIGEANVTRIRHLRIDADAYLTRVENSAQIDVNLCVNLEIDVSGSGDRFISGVIEISHDWFKPRTIGIHLPRNLEISARTAAAVCFPATLLLKFVSGPVTRRLALGTITRPGHVTIWPMLAENYAIHDDWIPRE